MYIIVTVQVQYKTAEGWYFNTQYHFQHNIHLPSPDKRCWHFVSTWAHQDVWRQCTCKGGPSSKDHPDTVIIRSGSTAVEMVDMTVTGQLKTKDLLVRDKETPSRLCMVQQLLKKNYSKACEKEVLLLFEAYIWILNILQNKKNIDPREAIFQFNSAERIVCPMLQDLWW